jgi:gliding motility-associated-like protein
MKKAVIGFCLALFTLTAQSQNISGTVNAYSSVTNIVANVITVGNPAVFSVGNLALLIQMKGATIDQVNTVAYGNILSYGDAGNFEYVRITAIAGNAITIQQQLCRTYTISGVVQLVRVPEYVNPTITGTLTGLAWNGSTGGVIAIDVSGTLTMSASVDASGLGFRGGTFTSGGFGCNNNNYRLPLAQAGVKGEGIAAAIAGQETAMGKIANGGGGANPGNPGGGGGGNFGAGGLGGREYSGCGATNVQGRGGIALSNAAVKTFMGGGGGGGFRDNGQTVTAGSNGGGIIMVRASNIVGNGNTMRSNGVNITVVTNDEGAGGGGAGGSVLITCPSFVTNLNVQTNGGDGGDNFNNIFTNQCHGPGGGGGAGSLWVSLPALPGNVIYSGTGGQAGLVGNPASPCFNTTNLGTNGGNGGVMFNLALIGGVVAPVNLGPDVNLCPGDTLILNAGAGYTVYQWQNLAATQTFTVTTGGVYHVTVTGSCGTTDRDTVTVTMLPAPVVNLGNDTVICSGNSLLLDAGAGFASYNWQNGSSTQTFSVNTSGTYHVTVTNASNCDDRDSIQVTVNPSPVVNLGPDQSVCGGTNVTLDAGAGFSGYLWHDGSSGQTFSTTVSGVYHVTVTNAFGCTDRDSLTLTVNPNPIINLGNDTLICQGQSMMLDPGAGYTNYIWHNGSGAQTFNATSTGNYHVTVTDANGCTDRDTIALIVPIFSVNLGPDVSFCMGETVTFSAGAGFSAYLWNNNSTASTLTVNSTGVYSVTVTGQGGCTATDQVSVLNVWTLPTPNIGPDQTLCAGQIALLDAGPGYSAYQWGTGPVTQTAPAANVGTYAVTVTDNNGCIGSDQMDITAVFPLPFANLGPDQILCEPSTATLDPGAGGTSFQWSNGANSQSIVATTSGTYYVTVTNSCGSVVDGINIGIFPAPPVLDLGPDVFICNDEVVLSANESFPSYLWNIGATTGSITVKDAGTYWLTAGNECGSFTDTIEVITECEPNLFWPNAFTPNGDGLNDRFQPAGDQMEEFSIQIFDRWGMLIYQSDNQNNGWDGFVRSQEASEGVYTWVASYRFSFRLLPYSLSANGTVTLLR